MRKTTEVAGLACVNQLRLTQATQPHHLAPDIQEKLLFLPPIQRGRDCVTAKHLRAIAAEPDWGKQRAMWVALKPH